MSAHTRLSSFAILLFLTLPVLGNPTPTELVDQLLAAKDEKTRLAILEAHKDALNKELITALNAAGERSRFGFDYPNSLTAYRLAEILSEKIHYPAGKSEALRGIGRIHSLRSEFDQAMTYFQEALEVSEKANDLAGKADALRMVAQMHSLHGKNAEEIKCLQESLRIEESIQNKSGMAKSLFWIGVKHLEAEEQELGFEELQKSLRYSKEVGDLITVATCLNSIGVYYDYRGNYDVALEYYHRSEDVNRASGNLLSLSNNLHNIGTVYYSKGNFIAALRYYEESLTIREKMGGKRNLAFSLSEIGTLYAEQGQLDLALKYLNESYEYLQAANDPYWSAEVLSDIGVIYSLSGDSDKAISYFEKSLPELRKYGVESDTADTLDSMARAYVSKGQFDKALESYRVALSALKDQRIFMKAVVLEGMSWTENAMGDYKESLRHANEVVELSRNHEFQELLWSALLTRGRNYSALQQPNEARLSLEESILVLENVRQQVAGGEVESQRYLERRTEPYAAMIELLIGEKKNEEALFYAERAKAKVLLDVMQKGRLDVTKAMTSKERKEEMKLKENLNLLNVELRETESPKNDAELAVLKTKLEKARLEHNAFQTNLYAAHPELKVQRGDAEIASLEKMRSAVPDDRTAFLEFVVSKDRTFLFFLTQSAMDIFEIDIPEQKLHETISTFRKQISKRDPGFRATAKTLYALLLSPIENQLKHINHTMIVPDGILWELPFQALVADNNKYLLENIAISYAPSMTTLVEMQKARKPSSNRTILAFANPTLGKETTERVQMVFRDTQLHPLPEAEIEVKKLADLYGSDRTTIFLGSEAKESALKKEIGNYGVVHLATHGILNETSPMYSHLVFSRLENTDKEDGLLEAWEIMNMNLKADLVVLSACETARGRIGAGEGVIGLNWAFFVAGCPTTVVSQWKVESSSTADLMFRFHQNLQKASAPQALRNAALTILKNPQYKHPFYWASFIVVGDPS